MMEVKKAYANFMSDKLLEDTIFALRVDGDVDTFRAARFDPQVLELSGDVNEIAQWLTDQRNKHLNLTRGTGWFLYHHFMRKRGTVDVFHAVIAWADRDGPCPWPDGQDIPDELRPWYHDLNWQGPLEDLGVVFLSWHAWLMQAIDWDKYEEELAGILAAKAQKDIAATEDARAFEGMPK